MPHKSLSHFIAALEKADEIVKVKEFVDPRLEITEIVDRYSKSNGKALLFENTGTEFPLLINSLGSEKRICIAFGIDNLDQIGVEIGAMVKSFMGPRAGLLDKLKVIPALNEVASWMPKRIRGRGVCQEVIMDPPDLGRLPVLTCWPADGGPFITLPAVHTVDPETGIRNVGMYRMQVFGPDLTGMHWHLHKGSANHFNRYRELRRRMPVSVTLGGDPAYIYAATAPLPENIDEYMLAGFLRKKRVELVKCITNEIEVPGDVDFVIEGYVDPLEDLILEGPFGDHTGFYSLAGYFPKFHVTCITHRKHAIYPATVVGIPPMEDGIIGKATEKIFLEPIRLTVAPEVIDMHMPVEGVFHNITLVKIKKQFPGQAIKVMNALWGAGQMMFNKIMVVTDEDVSLSDYGAFARMVSRNLDPSRDIHFSKGPVDILDHSSSAYAFGSKMGIDATRKLPEEAPVKALKEPAWIDREGISRSFPMIRHIDDSLASKEISLLVLGVEKSHSNQVKEMGKELLVRGLVRGFKVILFADPAASLLDFPSLTWISANNIDPNRDCLIAGSGKSPVQSLIIDATRKTKESDGFERDWPNVIVMDSKTMKMVDENWDRFGLGPFIASPSNRYKTLVENPGATADK
jgi:4-hydroxy-3-polyprenylbenzoate decarboxylase